MQTPCARRSGSRTEDCSAGRVRASAYGGSLGDRLSRGGNGIVRVWMYHLSLFRTIRLQVQDSSSGLVLWGTELSLVEAVLVVL